MLILAIVNGFAGYSLLDDLLSGTGLRIAYSIVLVVPVDRDSWLASLIFGGAVPGRRDIMSRLFVIHVLIVPALDRRAGRCAPGDRVAPEAHPVHRTGPDGEERGRAPTCGRRTRRGASACSSVVAALLAALGGLVQINPVWLYGPYDPAAVSRPRPNPTGTWAGSRARCDSPARGGSTLFGLHASRSSSSRRSCCPGSPSRSSTRGRSSSARLTHDHAEHHLLDRPRDRPVRTAHRRRRPDLLHRPVRRRSQDIIAQKLDVSIEHACCGRCASSRSSCRSRVGLFTWKLARDLRAAGPEPVAWTEVREPTRMGQSRPVGAGRRRRAGAVELGSRPLRATQRSTTIADATTAIPPPTPT